MSIRKMEQVEIVKVNLNSGFVNKKSGELIKDASIFINEDGLVEYKFKVKNIVISESIFSREFDNNLENFIIFNFGWFNDKTLDLEKEIIRKIFNEGIVVDSKLYRPFIQSSSQNRDNELIFTCLEDRVAALSRLMKIDLNEHPKFNISLSSKYGVVVNKFMSRAGMTLANGLATTVHLNENNYTAIKDLVNEINVKGFVYDYDLNNNELFKINKKPKHPVTDGQNYMSIVKACEIACGVGLINSRELVYFLDNWRGLDSLEHDESLKIIFDKFYKVMQLRTPGIKGLFIAIDFYSLKDKMKLDIMPGFNKISNDIHFILGEGGLKYVPDCAVELQYMQGNKDKRLSSTLSMQTLNSLNLSIEDANILTDRTIEMFNRVLTDVDYALEFLGTYFPTDLNAKSIDEVLVTKVHKALVANPESIKESWVKKALAKKLLGKRNKKGKLIEKGALQRAKYGKLPVKGNFFFVITDPYAHLGLGEQFDSGEIYFNDFEQKVSLFRYPNVHESEIVKADTVKASEYSYLKNVIIVNSIDDTLPRMGGADTDGDLLLIVFDEVIVKNTPNIHPVLPYGEGAEAVKTKLTLKSYNNKLMESIFDNSKIGQITNNATIFRDFENSLNNKDRKAKLAAAYHQKVFQLRFLQGYEIDKAKTGVKVEINDDLKPKYIPTWFFRYLFEYKGVSIDYLKENYSNEGDWDLVIDSSSALGHIYRKFRDYEEALKLKIEDMQKGTSLKGFLSFIISHKDFNSEDAKDIYKYVESLEKGYRKEISLALNHDDKNTKNYHAGLVFNKYQKLMDDIDVSGITKLYVSYTIVTNRESNSDSFYRSFCFDDLIKVYGEMSKEDTLLIKVDDMVQKVTIRGDKVYFDGELTDKTYFDLKGKRKSYKTFELENGTYIRALLKKDLSITEKISKEEREVSMALTVLGLQYNSFKEMTPDEVKENLSDSILTLNTTDYKNKIRIALFSDGDLVGLLPESRNRYAEQYLGFQLTYVDSIISITKKGYAKTLDIEFLFETKVSEVNEVKIKENKCDEVNYNQDRNDFESSVKQTIKATVK